MQYNKGTLGEGDSKVVSCRFLRPVTVSKRPLYTKGDNPPRPLAYMNAIGGLCSSFRVAHCELPIVLMLLIIFPTISMLLIFPAKSKWYTTSTAGVVALTRSALMECSPNDPSYNATKVSWSFLKITNDTVYQPRLKKVT